MKLCLYQLFQREDFSDVVPRKVIGATANPHVDPKFCLGPLFQREKILVPRKVIGATANPHADPKFCLGPLFQREKILVPRKVIGATANPRLD
jgi:hypothetical protein